MRCPFRKAPAIVLLFAFSPLSATAGNDVFIVPQLVVPLPTQPSPFFEFDDQDLLANDDDSNAQIVSFTTTSRGALDRESGQFTYRPGEEFWSMGMDFFGYVSDAAGGPSAIVFLIADPLGHPDLTLDMELEVGLPTDLIARGGTLATGPLIEKIALGTTSESTSLETFIFKPGDDGDGKIGTELDPGLMAGGQGDELTFASLGDLELNVGIDDDNYILSARRVQSGEVLATTVLADGPQVVAARWWTAADEAVGNGGLVLQVGHRIVAGTSGVRRLTPPAPTPSFEVRFGAMNVSIGLSGALHIDQSRAWIAPASAPNLLPLFADGVESSDLSAWSGHSGIVEVSAPAAIHGSKGIELPGPFPADLTDPTPSGAPRYRARFSLDPRQLSWSVGDKVTLLEAIDSFSTAIPFAVELKQRGGLELCAATHSRDHTPIALGCKPLQTATVYSVEVRWWSAEDATTADGGLKVWIDSDPLDSQKQLIGEELDLDNSDQTIGEIRFGAMDPQGTADGPLYLDDFESWR